MPLSARRDTVAVPNSGSSSSISPNSGLENKEPNCGTLPKLKTTFGSAGLQSNKDVYDKEQNCNNHVTDSVTRSALQTNMESSSTCQKMNSAKTSSGQNRTSFSPTQMVSPIETFLM